MPLDFFYNRLSHEEQRKIYDHEPLKVTGRFMYSTLCFVVKILIRSQVGVTDYIMSSLNEFREKKDNPNVIYLVFCFVYYQYGSMMIIFVSCE